MLRNVPGLGTILNAECWGYTGEQDNTKGSRLLGEIVKPEPSNYFFRDVLLLMSIHVYFLFFLCVYTCVHVCMLCVCKLWRSSEGCGSPRAVVIDGCEHRT